MSYCDYWADCSAEEKLYHDAEWGEPLHDDRGLFEFLSLEVMQCGLSWSTVFRKRAVLRACFAGFDGARVAEFTDADVQRIMAAEGMIRSERKIRAVIGNAARFREIAREFGSFDRYLWAFTGGKTILYAGHEAGRVPASNALSERIAADLRRRGFKFLGPVTVYAFLQAAGLVCDHGAGCPRYREITSRHPCVRAEPDGEKP